MRLKACIIFKTEFCNTFFGETVILVQRIDFPQKKYELRLDSSTFNHERCGYVLNFL